MIRAVIFDIDGTLIDSVDLHAQAWKDTFKHFGKDVPYEQVRNQIGKGGDQLMPVFFSTQELSEIGEEMEKFRSDLYKREYMPRVKGFPLVRELFERILADDKKIALASSAKGDELETYKRLVKIEDLIHAETSADDADKSKPHPDIFQASLKELGDPPVSEVLVVGDTPYDAEAAGKIRLRTIGVLSGGFPEAKLLAAGCMAIYEGPADLLARYEESPIVRV